MEQQHGRERANSRRQPSGGRRGARGDEATAGWHAEQQRQAQQQGYYFYPHYAMPYPCDQGSGAPSAWHPANYSAAVMHAPYAILAPPDHSMAAAARMPGPVYFAAAPAYYAPQQHGGHQGYPHQPHYWYPLPAATMMIGPGAYHMHAADGGEPSVQCSSISATDAPGGAVSSSGAGVAGSGEGEAAPSVACPDGDSRRGQRSSASGAASTSGADGSPPDCWGSLTVGVLQGVMAKLGDADVKQLRLVCRHWCGVLDANLESLTPNDLKARVLVRRFSNLKVLHLTNCSDIRNRSLWIISKAGLNLHTLTLGDDATKPWVTNRGLECIAQMTSLTSLNLHQCGGVTNKGLAALTNLRRLSALSLKGCCRLTNAAFEALQGHSSLTSLNLSGCRVTDKGLLPLTGLQLLSLHLGNTRVRDEGLGHLAQITSLQELHFDQEELTDAGVSQLTALTRLQSLALRDCAAVSSDSLALLIPALPNLISLDLYKNFTMNDAQLTRCLEFLGAVTYLDLRGTPVTEDGLQQLTKLSSLQKLCLAPTEEYLWSPYLCVVSNLTQLTSLSINNCTLISFGQLETLRQLKLLRELDLSGDGSSSRDEGREAAAMQQPVNPNAIQSMATITSLTSIDLSRRPVHQEHLSTLAEGLPRLHTLIIVGCPVLYTEVQTLQRRFPDLIIHRKPLFFDGSCSSSDHGIG